MKARTKQTLKCWARNALTTAVVLIVGLSAISAEAIIRFNQRHSEQPYKYGLSFSAEYAGYLGLNPQVTLQAMLDELKPDRLRLVGYWNQIEAERDKFNFEGLDWQMAMAESKGAKVTLALGLRQPRYPECHYPNWAKQLSEQETYDELIPFITAVVERYREHPALETYQLENEALLKVFGECKPFSRAQLVKEYSLVKNLDPKHPIAMNVSNEYGIPFGAPKGDQVGFSIYRRVFDSRVFNRYVNYPFPPLWFRNRAAIIERYIGGEVFIHELQTEPWGRKGTKDLTVAEQDEAYDLERFRETSEFARDTGIKQIDFWGAEWWLWRKTNFGDDSIWNAAKEVFSNRN